MIRTTKYACGAAASVLLLAACSAGNGAASAPTSVATTTGPAGGSGANGGQGQPPGVSGLIAAVTGSTMQVQSRTEQTAVSWTASTKITDQVATTSSAVKVGDCVSARPASTGAAPTGGPGSGSTATAPPTQPTTIDAATVQVLSTGTGTCDIAGFQGGRGPATGDTQTPQTPRPTGTGSASAGGFRGGGFGGFGTVTAVSGTTLTIQEAAFGMRPGSGSASPTPSASPSTRSVTVNFTTDTKFTTSQNATAAAIKAGECVTVQGTPDDTGAISATALSLAPATNGQCAGPGGRGA